MDAENGEFGLQEGSPCIDAANGTVAPEFDIDGSPRVDDPEIKDTGIGSITYADIGAYEFQPSSSLFFSSISISSDVSWWIGN